MARLEKNRARKGTIRQMVDERQLKKVTSNYDGVCGFCGDGYRKGDTIYWAPKDVESVVGKRRCFHPHCIDDQASLAPKFSDRFVRKNPTTWEMSLSHNGSQWTNFSMTSEQMRHVADRINLMLGAVGLAEGIEGESTATPEPAEKLGPDSPEFLRNQKKWSGGEAPVHDSFDF